MLSPLGNGVEALYDWVQLETVFLHYPWLKGPTLASFVFHGVIVCYGFIAGCMIWGGNTNGREIDKKFLLVSLFGHIAIALFEIAVLYEKNIPSEFWALVIQQTIKQLFGLVIFFVIWWLYFKKSKRVQNTYG
jgi:hypothetical protein